MKSAGLLAVSSAEELITARDKIRDGFVEMALEKSGQATPYVEEARQLRTHIQRAITPDDVWKIEVIRPALLAAAGLSQKAISNLQKEQRKYIYKKFVKEYLMPVEESFVNEIVYRFLLTKGDSLGGKMRNIGGRVGKRKMNRSILAALNLAGMEYRITPLNYVAEENIKAISWDGGKGKRTLAEDVKIGRNKVDACLIRAGYKEWRSYVQKNRQDLYLAMGELKSGFDPAGADEHWKTARSALERMQKTIVPCPKLFFVGTAIESAMSKEIFSMLRSGDLEFACNLTNYEQITAFCNWLITL